MKQFIVIKHVSASVDPMALLGAALCSPAVKADSKDTQATY
ncbi:hypothetical protein [Vibrio sp. LaRot3]|nr:hypothetical protein [Vibrio sp. LaRot3]MDA0149735.1 hypothetical protein [Vibrio sp. LaRot3]